MKFKINNQEIELFSGTPNESGGTYFNGTEAKINELIKALGTPLEEKKDPQNLIGKKIKGFKFRGNKVVYIPGNMDKYVGKVGEITYKDPFGNYKVDFAEGYSYYPASEIEKHILPDDYVEWSVEGLKEGDEYWTLNLFGDVMDTTWRNDEIDKWRKTMGQIFETEQDTINYKESKLKE